MHKSTLSTSLAPLPPPPRRLHKCHFVTSRMSHPYIILVFYNDAWHRLSVITCIWGRSQAERTCNQTSWDIMLPVDNAPYSNRESVSLKKRESGRRCLSVMSGWGLLQVRFATFLTAGICGWQTRCSVAEGEKSTVRSWRRYHALLIDDKGKGIMPY